MLWLPFSSLKVGENVAHSHPLPTRGFVLPNLLPHCGIHLCVGANLISMSFFKAFFWLVVDFISLVNSGQLRALQVAQGYYLLPHPVPQSLCQKTIHVSFDGPFSLMLGCVLKHT